MRNVLDLRPVIAGAVALLAFNAPLLRAQDRTPPSTGADVSEVRRTLTLEDYGGWKRIQGARLAPDGRWVSYLFAPNTGDDTLFVHALGAETRHAVPRGTQLVFSNDSRWAAYLVSPPAREGGTGGRGAAAGNGRGNTPQPRTLHLRDLTSGQTNDVPDVASFRFSNDAKFLAALRNKANREAAYDGADLVLRDLRGGAVQSIGNVKEYAFSDDGSKLAWTVDAAGQTGNGVYILNLRTSTLRTLDASASRYEGPVQLFEFLSGLQLTRDPGGQFEYSNVGVSLLGYILTQRTGMAYEDLLRVRILEPLGMKNTTITLSKEQLSQVTGQPMFELFPEQETEFFVKAVNAQISFLKDHTGAATGLVLHQNRANQSARKIR
jgi:hypothetical protein